MVDLGVVSSLMFLTYLLYIFVSGIVMIVFGILKTSYYSDYDLFLDYRIFVAPTLMIVTGCSIFFFCVILAKIASDGDVLDTVNCTSVCFFVLPVAIFILQLSAPIEVFVVRDKIISFLRYELQESMKHYEFDSNSPNFTTLLWDKIQVKLDCCGANGPRDWSGISHQEETEFDRNMKAKLSFNITVSTEASQSNDLPWSCCNDKDIGIGCKLNKTGSYFKMGCADVLGDNLKDQMLKIGLVCVVLFYLNIGLLLFTIYAAHISDY